MERAVHGARPFAHASEAKVPFLPRFRALQVEADSIVPDPQPDFPIRELETHSYFGRMRMLHRVTDCLLAQAQQIILNVQVKPTSLTTYRKGQLNTRTIEDACARTR